MKKKTHEAEQAAADLSKHMRDFERDAELKTLRSCLAQQTDLVNQLLQKLNSQEIEQEKKRPEAEETSKQLQHDLQTRSAKQDQDDSQTRPAKQKQKRMTSNTSRSTSTSPIKGQGDGTLELGRRARRRYTRTRPHVQQSRTLWPRIRTRPHVQCSRSASHTHHQTEKTKVSLPKEIACRV